VIVPGLIRDQVIGPVVENTGEYIQKAELVLKPNTIITVLPNLGSEYKIIFDLFITKHETYWPDPWHSIIGFAVDKGLHQHIKYGDRSPALWLHSDKMLHVTSSISGVSNFHKKMSCPVGKWTKIEICQHVVDNKLTYEVKINRKTELKVVNSKPCLFKGVKVFAGMPHYPTINGKIKNLYYETSDKTNAGKCVKDYRPKPVDSSGVLQGPELVLKRDHLITVVPYVGREYTITFDLYMNSYGPEHWYSILHFTKNGNYRLCGDRNPALWVSREKTIHVASCVEGMANYHRTTREVFPLKTWLPFKISQVLVGTKFIYSVEINGKVVTSYENKLPVLLEDMAVYAGDPWYPVQDGKIKNLVLVTQKDDMCVCSANTCPK